MTYARGYAIFYADLVFLLLHFLPREGIFLVPAEDDDLTVAEDLLRGRLCLSCKRIFYGSGIGVRYVSLYKTNRQAYVGLHMVQKCRVSTVYKYDTFKNSILHRRCPIVATFIYKVDFVLIDYTAGCRQKDCSCSLHLPPCSSIIHISRPIFSHGNE